MNIFGSVRRRRNTSKLGDSFGNGIKSPLALSGSGACDQCFLALQPIVSRRRNIFGYEVLFRSGWNNRFVGDSDAATQMMIDDWMFHGLDELTGGCRPFLNCTREALLGGRLKLLPPSIVLELLETIEPDREVLAACRRMKAAGYQIALDDFQHSERFEGLVALADYVKVDFRLSRKEERREIARRLRKSTTMLIAEKVETREEFEIALADGFQLFQGYFLGRPKVFSKRRVSTNHMNHFRRPAPGPR